MNKPYTLSTTTATPVLPGQTLGILGGGQLGRMIALEAKRMGYRVVTLDTTPDSPCGQVADGQIVATFDDVNAAKELAERSDAVLYEFENVDADVAKVLEQMTSVPQGSRLLRTTQHRIREKMAIQQCGLAVVDYRAVDSLETMQQAAEDLGFPCVLKTTQGGYDGKGQWLLRNHEDAHQAWEQFARAYQPSPVAIERSVNASPEYSPLVLEQFISFERELSVVVARNQAGEVRSFPVSENIHHHHILHLSIVPARVDEGIQCKAQQIAEQLAAGLNMTGLLAVEMFLTASGALYINEVAPRPHNSGHYTVDACVSSQFEQHIRTVCGLPLGNTDLLSSVVMVNILGEHVDEVVHRLPTLPPNMKLHLYGKHEAKVGRKMGHINVLADDVETALRQIEDLGIWNV